MIDPKIFTLGATRITVEISRWKSDKKTPAMFKCRIEHEAHSPSAIVAERDTAMAAEREATQSFIEYFTAKPKRASEMSRNLRPIQKPKDDFEY